MVCWVVAIIGDGRAVVVAIWWLVGLWWLAIYGRLLRREKRVENDVDRKSTKTMAC